MRFRTAHEIAVPLPASVVWDDVVDATRYERWWPWLDVVGAELGEGAEVSVSIPSPFLYRVGVVLAPTQVVPGQRLDADVSGDLRGTGGITLRSDGAGATIVGLTWDVEIVRPLLRALGTVAWPVLDWAHRRVVHRGARDYLQRRG